jgi:hypothetical protein
MGGELAFVTGREKAELDAILNRDVMIEDLAFVESKYDDGRENAVFTVRGDGRHFYRTGSTTAVPALKKLARGLEEDGLDWDALVIRFEVVKSKAGRRYYVVRAELTEDAKAELEAREIEKAVAAENPPF